MDSVRELVVGRLAEIGETLKSASEKLGRNHAYLQQFVQRGTPARLPEDVRRELAALLGVAEDALRGEAPARRREAPPREAARSREGAAREPQREAAPRSESMPPRNAALGTAVRLGRIPLYGQAVGGADGQFPLNGSLITEVAAPPSLAGVAGAYAVMVVGTSMEPRYFAGEAVFVNPRLPVRVGDFVVAQIGTHEGEPPLAYVKRYVGQNDKSIRLEQLNPPKKLAYPADRLVSIHRIVMSGEG
jgi:phage repressor protein C with HTH and peptisase S24 domain